MVFVFLFLTSLSMIISRPIHVATNGIILLFFLWLSIYIYMYINHIFFIHSSVDGHLGCFHVLSIVNGAAMNIGVHVSFQILVMSGYMPRSGMDGSYGNSTFSRVTISVPTNSVRGIPFLHTLSGIYYLQGP